MDKIKTTKHNKQSYWIITYGCQMNKSDSERIASFLQSQNFKKAKNKKTADLIIINACSVRQSAVDRVYGQINQIKKNEKKQKIYLTGCLTEKDKRALQPKVDLIFNIKELSTICGGEKIDTYFKIPPLPNNSVSVFVPISTGCDNFCSYCVVPYTRGREYHRPAEEILKEVEMFIKRGFKEIILLGQNVNSYHYKNIDFTDLLQLIENIPGNFWITFLTNHPKDLSEKLIDYVAKSKKVCPYFHLPVQSGDNKILKLMNRHYTVKKYIKQVKKLRKKIKDVCISTDIIVGIPTETTSQFKNTAKLMKKLKFDMAYIAQYSPRPQTALSKVKDDIPKKEKQKREQELVKILEKTALENNKKYLGKTKVALITKYEKGYLFGHLKNQKQIKIPSKKDLTGEMVKVKIIQANPYSLKGELIYDKK